MHYISGEFLTSGISHGVPKKMREAGLHLCPLVAGKSESGLGSSLLLFVSFYVYDPSLEEVLDPSANS